MQPLRKGDSDSPMGEGDSIPFSMDEIGTLQRELLGWYEANKRDLPWRRTADPYAIWVSEVMLQQTRVETVKPYWAAFISRFPTIGDLAAASLDEVLAQWSGLGYYARARGLHATAQFVVERYDGRLPANAVALAKLPGFGPYTTAAVGSIAFGLDEAAVDGNVARVFSRWLCREGDPRGSKALSELRRVGRQLLPGGRAGDWNQALMELGATLCSPGVPGCVDCPVENLCRAKAAGRQNEIPERRKAKERPTLRLAAAWVRRGDAILLARRPDRGLFASMWELPAAEVLQGADEKASLAEWLGAGYSVGEPIASVSQTLTHREYEVVIYEVEASVEAVPAPYVDSRFSEQGQPPPGGLSSVTRKALKAAWAVVEG